MFEWVSRERNEENERARNQAHLKRISMQKILRNDAEAKLLVFS